MNEAPDVGNTVEVTFSYVDESCFMMATSNRLDCTVTTEEILHRQDGTYLAYYSIDAPCEEAIAVAEEHEGIKSIRVISESEEGCLVEAILPQRCAAGTLADYQAVAAGAMAESGEGTVRAEIPAHVSVRDVVEGFIDAHPGSELRAKRERADSGLASVSSADERSKLLATLTEKQRDAIRTAVMSGYFAWPRQSTAAECADALGIAQPTFSQHLYRGLEQLLSQVFDETRETEDPCQDVTNLSP